VLEEAPRRWKDGSQTRKEHLAAAILAGALAAGVASMPPQGAQAVPMRMDKEVWAPLEDYMQAADGAGQNT
jgi:hypothetical protein